MPRLADLIDTLDLWFDPAWAESWDAVGTVCGDRSADVRRVLLALDAVPATVEEAVAGGTDLLVTHHPLLLSGVHGVPADSPKGALVHRMVRAGVAHHVAHTNADVAEGGVSDALARLIGLTSARPLVAQLDDDLLVLVVLVPPGAVGPLVDALSDAGAGAVGNDARPAWTTAGSGSSRPGPGAAPAAGRVGAVEVGVRTRVEMVLPTARRDRVVAALHEHHPDEVPAFELLVRAPSPTRRGTGRIGGLPQGMTLRDFTDLVAKRLPATAGGVRAAGDPDRPVRTVAVCGGSGGSLAEVARRAGADVLLTSDLKHHPALEEVAERPHDGIALVDAAHWATEAPWLDELAVRLREHFADSVEVRVSRRVTDPWTLHAPSTRPAAVHPTDERAFPTP